MAEAQFCEFSANKDGRALKSLVGVNLEDQPLSALSEVESVVFEHKSKLQTIKDFPMVPARLIKRSIISLVKAPTRKIKNMMVGR
ncbi:hypothetical protein L7D45_14690 [Brucella pseudogrignonensis]|nr:hypothetical protein [Brucella pseudogrignonensis]UKK94995.1 hypothetical protein L7D45_14690 [Brucella pseudogrignonensis]